MSNGTVKLEQSTYDKRACAIGVVHIGFGAFHRAHQALYLDSYMEQTGDLRWGVAAVNLRAADAEAFGQERAAEGYVLKTMSSSGETSYRLVRPHLTFKDWTREAGSAEALIALPSVHLVTMTVTEGGYALDGEGRLDRSHPAIVKELAGEARETIYAYLALGLYGRMTANGAPITLLCCDNIRENGAMLRRNFLEYLEAAGMYALRDWVLTNVRFPSSMVDRITPRSNPELSDEVHQLFGIHDPDAVMSEDFLQWVIEDDFAGERPQFEQVGATLTADVHPYEEAKIRILNGGHTGLVYFAALARLRTFDEAMRNEELRRRFMAFEQKEVLPALTLKLPFDKSAYLDVIAARFENRHIGDTVERISADGVAKFPVFIRPTLIGVFEAGATPIWTIQAIASWFVFVRRTLSGHGDFPYQDANLDGMRELFDDPAAFAAASQLWGDATKRFTAFAPALVSEIEQMERQWGP